MLENGVPSEPTFCRVEKGIDDRQMAEALEGFSDSFRSGLTEKVAPDIICVDGKAMPLLLGCLDIKGHIIKADAM